jgi:hypothetical protein
MKRKSDSLTKTAVDRFVVALHDGDVEYVRELLEQYAEVRAAVNEPIGHFDSRPVAAAKKNVAMIDVLLVDAVLRAHLAIPS